MRISSVWYSFRQGLKNIRRNILFSLASIGTIVACLFLFGLFYSIIVNFQAAMKSIESNVTISVFFDEGLDDDRKKSLAEHFMSMGFFHFRVKKSHLINFEAGEHSLADNTFLAYDRIAAFKRGSGLWSKTYIITMLISNNICGCFT